METRSGIILYVERYDRERIRLRSRISYMREAGMSMRENIQIVNGDMEY